MILNYLKFVKINSFNVLLIINFLCQFVSLKNGKVIKTSYNTIKHFDKNYFYQSLELLSFFQL